MHAIRLILLVLLVFPGLAVAREPTTETQPSPGADHPVLLEALGTATAFTAALLAEDADAAAELAGGSCIWQQPGVALTITARWDPDGDPPELWLDEAVLAGFLQAQADLRFEAPFLYPGEAEYGPDGAAIEPVVCLLEAAPAADRFDRHWSNYRQWVSFNPGMDDKDTGYEGPETAAAVVYIHPGGALEFYFTAGPDGRLRLAQFMVYSYFSA